FGDRVGLRGRAAGSAHGGRSCSGSVPLQNAGAPTRATPQAVPEQTVVGEEPDPTLEFVLHVNRMLLTVDKMIYGGDGLARMPANEHGPGKAVFVPLVLPGEQVEVTIAEQRAGFARAELQQVVRPSEFRVPPGCPYFGPCGGCQYQHANYAH